jgi:hypothetical protein
VGGGFIEFVVDDAVLFPQVVNEITQLGQGHIRRDFVAKTSD